jgi:hypothetical protein
VGSGAGDIARPLVRSSVRFRPQNQPRDKRTVEEREKAKYCDERELMVLNRRFMVYYENTVDACVSHSRFER